MNSEHSHPPALQASQQTYPVAPPSIQDQNEQAPSLQAQNPSATQQPISGSADANPSAASPSDEASPDQEQDKVEHDRQVAAIREVAKTYNATLADFESFPAEYQMTADSEMASVIGAAQDGARVGMPRTNAMQKKLHEISDQLNSLFNQVMDDKIGQDLFQLGPLATAKNPGTERQYTNAFDEAAKIVETFPYLLPRQ